MKWMKYIAIVTAYVLTIVAGRETPEEWMWIVIWVAFMLGGAHERWLKNWPATHQSADLDAE